MKKKIVSLLLVFVMLLGMMPTAAFAQSDVTSQWANFRNSDVNMAITDAQTPISVEGSQLKWAVKHSTGWSDAPGNQLIVDDCIVTTYGKTIRKLSMEDGSIVKEATLSETPGYSVAPTAYADGMIILPLNNGKVEALDAKTLESKWLFTDELGGQCLSQPTYADGKIYTGFWLNRNNANFVCIDAKTGALDWSYTIKNGFYWAGAVAVGDYIVVGGEYQEGTSDSTGTPNLMVFKKTYGEGETVEPVSTLALTSMGSVRSSIAYANGRVYATTKGGYLVSAAVDSTTGALSELKAVKHGGSSTATPVVYGDKVYFGVNVSWKDGSYFVAANANTLEAEYKIKMAGNPQCSWLLTTAYGDDLYLYGTYNSTPGGITMIKVDTKTNTAEASELFTPPTDKQQYCIASVLCDEEGTLYYKNDSGYIFAIELTEEVKNENAVNNVKNMIDAIGTVTLGSESTIQAARNGYDKLSDELKALVTNYDVLVAAEKALDDLKEANKAADINVTVSISDSGMFVTDKDGNLVANVKVTASDIDRDGKVEVDEVLYAAHAAYNEDGANAYESVYNPTYGLGIVKLWGDESGVFGYWKNDVSCWSLEDEVKDGDSVKAFIYKDKDNWSDQYTKFEKDSIQAKVGEAVSVKLLGAVYAPDWSVSFEGYEGAALSVDGKELGVTGEDGSASVSFDKAGTYTVVAYDKEGNMVPSACTITVTAENSGSNENVPTVPGTTPDTNKPGTSEPGTTVPGETAPGADAPTTGDFNTMALWVVVMAAAITGAMALKKREN